MVKKILLIVGVIFILSLALFTGVTSLLFDSMATVVDTIKYIPLELRVIFFACWLALMWAFYDAIVT